MRGNPHNRDEEQMKTATLLAATTATLAASSAWAGGIDRVRTPYAVLFETGNYVEFGVSRVSPDIRGSYPAPLSAFGASTGDMANNYTNFSFAYKRDIDEKLSYGVFVNTPYGADSAYSQGFYTGLDAEWSSTQLAVVIKYKLNEAVSVYGGARYVSSTADIAIPDQMIRGALAASGGMGAAIAGAAPAGTLAYTAEGARDGEAGLIVGAAYERPDIALRVALTYESQITHDYDTVETMAFPGLSPLFGESTTEVTLPQTLTLDFQTGIAEGTLLFGSIRWSEWSEWEVRPQGYDALTGNAVTGYKDNVTTYQLGIGRKLTDELSVFARAGYEASNNDVASRLSPYDGQTTLALGGTWRRDAMKVTAGIEYAWLGDTFDASGVQFKNNDALGIGISVGYSF
jgi:long-subunit fatty acid transport protein